MVKRLKSILFISPTGDFGNGAERSIYQLMKQLVRLGYQVFNAYPSFFPSIEENYRSAFEEIGVVPICVPGLRWWPDSPIGDALLPADSPADEQAVEALCAIIRQNDITCVLTNTVNIYHGAIATKQENVKHIWLIHEFPEEDFAYYRNKIAFIHNSSDAVFCVAGALNDCLNKLFKPFEVGAFLPFVEHSVDCHSIADNKLSNTNNPADASKPTNADQPEKNSSLAGNNRASIVAQTSNNAQPSDNTHPQNAQRSPNVSPKHRLISIGLITENKNQLELLEAYSLLPQKIQENLEVVFIGAKIDEYQAHCDEFIQHSNLERISFLGFQDNPWVYACANDIVVLTSKSETFGCVYAEAVINGTPVIASNNAGYETIHNHFDTGTLYPLGNTEALANTIESTLQNFAEIKQEAVNLAPKARAIYNAENAYSEILTEIARNNKPRHKWGCNLKKANKLCTLSH